MVAERICNHLKCYAVIKSVYKKAFAMPMIEARITTHFQQYVLFIFFCFININVHLTSYWFC